MATQPKAGEMLTGAYLKLVADCEIVAYGQHSPVAGEQMEIDVIGLQPRDSNAVVACEVATHLGGLGYGNAATNAERVAKKFENAAQYVDRAFDDASAHRFQFWSPNVPRASQTRLEDVASSFEAETGHELELVTNETYTLRVDALRDVARDTVSQRNELAFRFLQILEHCR